MDIEKVSVTHKHTWDAKLITVSLSEFSNFQFPIFPSSTIFLRDGFIAKVQVVETKS